MLSLPFSMERRKPPTRTRTMMDGPFPNAPDSVSQEDSSTQALASRVLYVMASRVTNSIERIDRAAARKLAKAVLEPAAMGPDELVALLADEGVAPGDITDLYIPYVARNLGEMWVEDTINFTDVTVATARLQGMLREVDGAWSGQTNPAFTAPTVLMIVPEGETHTLGVFVAAGQLRRAGASVQLCVGEADEAAMGMVEQNDYDMIMISFGHSAGIEALRRLIQNIRYSLHTNAPIVVGGPIVALEEDLMSLTRADMVTDRPTEALRLCMKRGIEIGEQKRA